MVAEGAAQLCRTLCRLCLTDQNSLEDLRNLGFAVLDKCENNENALQSEREKNNLRRALESKDDSLLHDFLVCFEHCRTPEVITLLARILIEYINPSSEESKQRLQLLAKMNGASYLAKSLRSQLQIYDGSAVMNNSLAALIKVTLLVGGVDGRFYIKVRFGGLLALAANVIATREGQRCIELLQFLTSVCHSGKNAAFLSKHEKFILFIKSTFKDYANEEINVIHHCAKLLYLMAKPKSTRLILVTNGIVQSVMELFQAFFAKEEENAWTVCMAALGTVRLLTSTMAGRQTLVECNGLTIFREAVKSFNVAEQSNRNCSFLYHAMSSLCLRCLPMCSLPVDSVEHPITVHLPVTRTDHTPADILSDSEEELSIAAGFLTDTDDETMVVQKPGLEGPPTRLKLFQSEMHLYRFLCRELEFGMDENTESASQANHDVDEAVEFNDTIRKCLPRRRRNSLSEVSGLRFSIHKKDESDAEKALYASLGRRASLDSGPRPDPVWYSWMDYVFQAASTHSVYQFVTIAFPDYHGLYPNLSRQRLKFCPNTLLEMLEPLIDRVEVESFPAKVVYDLDALLKQPKTELPAHSLLSDDLIRLGKVDAHTTSLKFESRFESGNLRKAIQVGPYEYDLILTPDTNQINEYFHTFYFKVWNMVSNVPYTFNIINCVKTRSLYNSGMQPVVFSVTEALLGRPGWVRSGRSCVYYRNFYSRSHAKVVARSKAPQTITSYYTASFTVHFRHAYDMCYFAYHYPYTYTMLKTHLVKLSHLLSCVSDVRFRIDTLCRSIAGNPVKLLTITNAACRTTLQERDVIVISSRVHPGESNSSWMMHGLLNYLVSPQPRACLARSLFIFKIIPMLNVDGVVNGNHRCSLAGEDLNRQWVHPDKSLFPSVYHTKNLIGYLHHIGKTPLVYCDFHGHSRKKNIFAYGNNPNLSWYSGDRKSQHQFEFYQLPEILDDISPAFHLKYCSFDIKKNKEGSARVAVWRDTSLCRAYTMEASYAGFDHGPYEGYQMTTKDLIEMGEKFIDALVCLKESIRNNEMATRKFELGSKNSKK